MIDPAELWDRYCEEVPAKRRSPQGAMAFAVDALTSAPPQADGEAAMTWTPEQYWEYVGGLAGDFERDQMRVMMAERGLSITAPPQCAREPVAWFCFVPSPHGEAEPLRIRAWTTDEARATSLGEVIGRAFTPLYASPVSRPDGGGTSEDRPYCDPTEQAKAFYLAMYENKGANWDANENQDVWVKLARDYERRRREAVSLSRPDGDTLSEGGFSLGLERAGMRTVAFCEINDYCRRVLATHWPDAHFYTDIRTLTADRLISDGVGPIDVICGGFPCQDISTAGKGAGIEGARSGLWSEYARIIGELRPRHVIVENVSALLSRGLDRVLGDLAALGYDAEWHCISASAIGAPHERDRVWIVAYPDKHGLETNADQTQLCEPPFYGEFSRRLGEMGTAREWIGARPIGARPMGMDNGISSDVDRLRALGNAVVPQIPEIIGRAIMRASAVTSHNTHKGEG